MVVVVVAGVQEGGHAVLQGVEAGLEREQLVAGDHVVVVEVAPLPDGGVGPAQALVADRGLLRHRQGYDIQMKTRQTRS